MSFIDKFHHCLQKDTESERERERWHNPARDEPTSWVTYWRPNCAWMRQNTVQNK